MGHCSNLGKEYCNYIASVYKIDCELSIRKFQKPGNCLIGLLSCLGLQWLKAAKEGLEVMPLMRQIGWASIDVDMQPYRPKPNDVTSIHEEHE